MWSIEEELENKGFVRGRTEGKTEDILLLLEELGPVPSHTAGRIRQERDPETLKRWLKNCQPGTQYERIYSEYVITVQDGVKTGAAGLTAG